MIDIHQTRLVQEDHEMDIQRSKHRISTKTHELGQANVTMNEGIPCNDETGHQKKNSIGDKTWIQYVLVQLNQNFHDADYSPLKLAKHLNMSERNLQRRFKAEFETTFKEMLIRTRLQHAKQLLAIGTKITDVAIACGFNEPSYFTRIFKQNYQMTPSDYRMIKMNMKQR